MFTVKTRVWVLVNKWKSEQEGWVETKEKKVRRDASKKKDIIFAAYLDTLVTHTAVRVL